MQTFFNPTTPFFDGEGKPMVNAMVSFVDVETSTNYISLTDNEGTALPNPLYTGSDGRLRLNNGNGAPAIPCIADGLSYKVTVAKRTGVEPVYIGGILQNPVELYEAPYIVFVVTAAGSTGIAPNTAVVDTVADMRLADKSIGTAVCIGYHSAGDCPARVFTWIDSVSPPSDNGINILRSPDDNTGYWKMEDPSSGMWDVRMAGVMTTRTAAQNSQQLTALVNLVNGGTYTDVTTIYFPAGNWVLDTGFSFSSLVIEKGANFKTADNLADITVSVTELENRGGKFCAYDLHTSDHRVILATKGLLRSSWLDGSINEFLTATALANVDEIIFDSITADGVALVTISGKRVLQKTALPDEITFQDCERFISLSGVTESDILRYIEKLEMGGHYSTEFVNDLGGGKEHVKHNNDDIVVIDKSYVEVLKNLLIQNFTLNSGAEGWTVWHDGSDWDGLLFLLAAKGVIQDLRVNTVESNVSATLKKGGKQLYDAAINKVAGDSVDDTDFASGNNVLVIFRSSTGGGVLNITATPTAGRAIKVATRFTDQDYFNVAGVQIQINGSTDVAIAPGATAWFTADGANWIQDLSRL